MNVAKACKVLGIGTKFTKQELRQAFLLQAKKHHPVSGGSSYNFKMVMDAYSFLKSKSTLESSQGPEFPHFKVKTYKRPPDPSSKSYTFSSGHYSSEEPQVLNWGPAGLVLGACLGTTLWVNSKQNRNEFSFEHKDYITTKKLKLKQTINF